MCGICGEVRFDGGRVDAGALAWMRDQLVHRGPDSFGRYVSPDAAAGLGFRRLAIIDLNPAANQPMGNEDGSIQIVYNGEIYNYAGIREELIARGHTFRSRSDTEVIVHLYEEYGDACIDRLDGMFALAIWDNRLKRLVLARDRAGKKPLFYAHTDTHVVFGSEIKAFFGRRDVDLSVDPAMVPYYFIYGYVPCPDTFYRGVRQLEPGTVMVFDRDGRSTSRRFWQLQFPEEREVETVDHATAKATLRELMTAAVERRLMSDVPLGAFLSGGVDSTIVVALMSRLTDRPVKTFSIGFKDSPGYDETSYARIVAERYNTDHTEFVVAPGAFDLVERLVWSHDGPFGDSSAVPTSIVSELTRQQVTVVLTGDGGDELFAGYSRFYAAVTAERTPALVRQALKMASRAIPAGPTPRHLRSRVQRFAAAATLPLDERITRWSSLFYDDVEQLVNADVSGSSGTIDRLRYLRRVPPPNGLSPLSRVLQINFNTYLLDDLLVKTDRCTMANSLEARSPFLDTALMEYVAALPDAMKLDGRRTKAILRDAFDDLIPPAIQRRGKMGFGIPFGQWFRGSLRGVLDDLLLAPDARYREYLSPAYVHRVVHRHHAGEADLGLHLWTLLTFEIWLRSLPGWRRAQPPVVAETPA
jgi:asparagine synthase (glutamine-hydrolysing)